MNIVVIDNYDSFTINLCNLIKTVRPEHNLKVFRNLNREIFNERIDAVVVSPGPKTPAETGILHELTNERIVPERIPYFGVCLGLQFIGHYFGCKIKKSGTPTHGNSVNISHSGVDIFENIASPFKVARYNSLEFSTQDIVHNDLEILATETGRDAVMALRHKSLPMVGVQFHPESFLTECGDLIIDNFFKQYV